MKLNRKGLVSLVLAVALVMTMMTSGTIAWFTDEVTSAVNVIQAGNLDLEVTANGKAVTDKTEDIFTKPVLWEPGAVATAELGLKNVGDLALKYQMTLEADKENTVKDAEGNEHKLSEVIKIAYVMPTSEYGNPASITDRDVLIKLAKEASPVAFGEVVNQGTLYPVESGKLNGMGGVLVAYWEPGANDNNYNLNNGKTTSDKQPLHINFVLNVVATQLNAEFDSFGNDYDAGTNFADKWDGTIPASKPDTLVVDMDTQTITVNDAQALMYLSTLAKSDDFSRYQIYPDWTIELKSSIDLQNYPINPILVRWGKFDGNNNTIYNVNTTTGLFAAPQNQAREGGTSFSNLHLVGVKAYAPDTQGVGAVMGSANGSYTNVTVKDADITGKKYVGGVAGSLNGSIIGSKVIDSVVTIPDTAASDADEKTVGGLVGYAVSDGGTETEPSIILDVRNNLVEGTTVSGTINVGGMIGHLQGANDDIIKASNNVVRNTIVGYTGEATGSDVNADGIYARRVGNCEINTASDSTENVTVTKLTNGTFTDNGTTYAINAEGVQAALTNADKVVLTNDVAIDEKMIGINGTGKEIDLNGNTLTGSSALTSTANFLRVNSGAELKISNGTVDFTAANPDTDWGTEGFPTYATNTIRVDGKLIIDGATIINSTGAGGASYAIDCYSGADLIINNGVIKQTNGDVAIRMFANSATTPTNVTINGGEISGRRAVWIHLPSSDSAVAPIANLTITGGTLTGTDPQNNPVVYSYSYGNSFANTKVNISGGTFNGDVCFGGGYKGDQETVNITGGTFNGELGRYLANDGWEDIAKP